MANIVICADGTWNGPEEDIEKNQPTNVLRFARAIEPSSGSTKQHVFYDWGLGAYHDRVIAGATGKGIHKNILDGYRYIVQNYSEGDRIYLFGFSRGAYTIRSLCGLINNCGILRRVDAPLIAEAWRIYKSPAKKNHPNGDAAVRFRDAHAYLDKEVYFVGAWDTVGALGIPFSFMGLFEKHDEFYDTRMGGNVAFVRHALAIDERRVDFAPTIWTPRPGIDLKQVWFAGAHADIGGGAYPADKGSGVRSSDVPLAWMLKEASAQGLTLEPHLEESLTDGTLGKTHKSRNHVYRLKSPLERELVIEDKPTKIHPSVKVRYETDSKYRPPQLQALVERVGWDGLDVGD